MEIIFCNRAQFTEIILILCHTSSQRIDVIWKTVKIIKIVSLVENEMIFTLLGSV